MLDQVFPSTPLAFSIDSMFLTPGGRCLVATFSLHVPTSVFALSGVACALSPSLLTVFWWQQSERQSCLRMSGRSPIPLT